jgi:hypothetical protein
VRCAAIELRRCGSLSLKALYRFRLPFFVYHLNNSCTRSEQQWNAGRRQQIGEAVGTSRRWNLAHRGIAFHSV